MAIIAFRAAGFELTPDRKLQYAEGIIPTYYVEPVDRDTIVDEAIKAMLKTLDPHSVYSTPEETRELNEPLLGNFSGVVMLNCMPTPLKLPRSGSLSSRVSSGVE